MVKSLFRLSLSFVTGFVQTLNKLCDFNWTVLDYSKLCIGEVHIVISYQKSSDTFHLLVDSISLKLLGEGK